MDRELAEGCVDILEAIFPNCVAHTDHYAGNEEDCYACEQISCNTWLDVETLTNFIQDNINRWQVFVTVYEVTRHYGGPEEGGWWYNWNEPVESVLVLPSQDAEEVVEQMTKRNEYRIWGDIYSVCGGMDILVMVEATQNKYATKCRPHYE